MKTPAAKNRLVHVRGAQSQIPLVAILVVLLLMSSVCGAAEPGQAIDWNAVAAKQPDLKVLVLVESSQSLSLRDLAWLADRGFVPADRDPGLIVGLKQAVFKITIGNWKMRAAFPPPLQGRLITRFRMSGIYRVAFKVVAREYEGPLSLEVTAPRSSFGKKLIFSDYVVRPATEASVEEDAAGNRWLSASFPRAQTGETIKMHMSFTYVVDVAELLEHDLFLVDAGQQADIPADVVPYLGTGYKIDPHLPRAKAWAARTGSDPPNARLEFRRLTKTLLNTITYNTRKKAEYFGGLSVYSDLDHMYQNPRETLGRGTGCCPDTVLLECSYLRARGIPCRTAGRFGHFFSEVYVPGHGWMSTSVTPTGIPLIASPSPDHVPYQTWEPSIALRTSRLEARIRIEPLEEQP